MPHTFERAPTGRAKCRACGAAIASGDWRFGERLPNPYADGENVEMTHWFHLSCAAFKRPEPFVSALEALDLPVPAFDEREMLEREARLGIAHPRLARVSGVGRAPSARAACRACKEKIDKDVWRIGLVWHEDGRFTPSGYVHLTCAAAYLETTEVVARLRLLSKGLSDADVAEIARTLSGDQ